MVDQIPVDQARWVCQVLELDVAKEGTWRDYAGAVRVHAESSDANRFQVALLAAMGHYELSYARGWNLDQSKRWYQWLSDRGWSPTPWDRTQLKNG